jgi:hypothetical protein
MLSVNAPEGIPIGISDLHVYGDLDAQVVPSIRPNAEHIRHSTVA